MKKKFKAVAHRKADGMDNNMKKKKKGKGKTPFHKALGK